jgi:protoporphyrinogen oxidase
MMDTFSNTNPHSQREGIAAKRFVVIGARAAGLSAAYELMKFNARPSLIDKYENVGGLTRTENYKGYHFDIGGHRFSTKVEKVNNLWHERLGENLLRRPRLSRIYYKGKFFDYSLKTLNALSGRMKTAAGII